MAGLNKEVWIADIQETLTQDAAFLTTMSDWTEFVDNEFINIPQAGAIGGSEKNTTTFPLTVAKRTDSVQQIKMDLYNTPAVLISEIESYQLSYNKRQSVMGQHVRQMVEFAGNTILQNVAPTDAAHQVSITGALTYEDVLAAAKILDKDNVQKFDRTLVLDTDMYYELLNDDKVIRLGWNQAAIEEGKILKVAGFSIYQRPSVATLSGQVASVGYQKTAVGYGKGAVDIMSDSGDNGLGNPLYLGAILTGIMKLGAGKARTDSKGTVALVRLNA
ncbi:phage capsid protein [Hymenobacter terrenus]|uniref:phage capsid protein n=1 Tax=Hymenobacter terrenus TaxID=1629124 RepID=UPI000619DE3E|nr:phage capsid protein [Hymenobacter terrenus]